MKKTLSLLTALAMAFSLAACGGQKAPADGSATTAPADTAATGDEIVIGGLAPLTGNVSQYGIAVNNGAMLAVQEVNDAGGILGGKKIKYVYEDEKGDPTEAINAYNKLVQSDKIIALLGDVTTKPTIAVAQVAAKDGLPMITASATGADVTLAGENIFRACFIDPYQGQLMAHYAVDKLGAKTAAVLYDTGDDYSQGVAEAFRDEAAEIGLELVSEMEGYSTGTDDFNAQLTKIKELNPDVIMAPCYYEDAAKIITQARNLGITAKFLGPDGWDGVLNQVDASNAAALNDSYYCSQYSRESDRAELQDFLAKYKETYNMDENMFAVLGYDAMHILLKAIDTAGSTDSAAIIEAIKASEHAGLTGTTKFDENRNPIREAYITVFEDGAAKVLEAYSFQ